MKLRLYPLPLLLILNVSAQSTIDPARDKIHSANAGWIDLRPTVSTGIKVTENYLSGKGYAANFGWVNFGNGNPANGHSYTNDSTTNYGVNLSAEGLLTGKAYAANIGWISFEQTHGKPRLNLTNGAFSGYAYSANMGWIALDVNFASLVAATIASPDSDNDQIADSFEFLHFGDLTTATATSDSDDDGKSDAEEYQANTSPVDATEFLSFSVIGGNGSTSVSYEFTAGPGRILTVQESDSLQSGSWGTAKIYQPNSTFDTVSDSYLYPVSAQRFFRLKVAKPLQP